MEQGQKRCEIHHGCVLGAWSAPASAVWIFPDGDYRLSFLASKFISRIDGLPRDEIVSGFITFKSYYEDWSNTTITKVLDANVRVGNYVYDGSDVVPGFMWPGPSLMFGAGSRGHAIDADDDIWLRFTPRTSLVEFEYVTSAGEFNTASVVSNTLTAVPEPGSGGLAVAVFIGAGLVSLLPTVGFTERYGNVQSGAMCR